MRPPSGFLSRPTAD